MSITDTARIKAEKILEGNFTPRGLVASRDWYKEVFARDSAISFIGACLLGKKKLYASLKRTIATLSRGQTECGLVPTCVIAESGVRNFGTLDSTAWLIVLAYFHYTYTNDKAFLAKQYPHLVRAVRCLQANGRLENDCVWSQESDDWNDDWSNHGQTLFVNTVWQATLKYMSILAGELGKRADKRAFIASHRAVRKRIDEALWVPDWGTQLRPPDQLHQAVCEPIRNLAKARNPMRHYLAFVSRGSIGSFCDVISNAMAICFGQSDAYRTGRILDYFQDIAADRPYPAPVIYPPVQEGSEHWRDYFYGGNLNLPYHYHNGGVWPHCGGFYVAAHVKAGRMDRAEQLLVGLAELNKVGRDGEWEFIEWVHGQTGRPWGSKFMSWSAGMYIYAYEVLRNPSILEILDPSID